MNYQDVKTSDDRDMWLWQREQEAAFMAQNTQGDQARHWYAEAEYCRRERWPKDRAYFRLYPV